MGKYSLNGYELRTPSGRTFDGGMSLDDATSRLIVLRLPEGTQIVDLDDEVQDARIKEER